MTARIRAFGRATLAAALTLVTAVGLLVVGAMVGTAQPAVQDLPAPRHPGADRAGKTTVAFVLGASGSDAADVLAPFEVFASSPDVRAYTVAASSAPAALGSGLAIVPDHTFADIEQGSAPPPDLVVVPAVERPDGAEEQPARAFITASARRGARLLGVCAGARLLAASGVLDGHRATSHWSRLGALRTSRPQVDWADGVRYLQDGRITTTAGVTSGIPGSLRVLADLVGAAEAERVGRLVDYPGWRLDHETAIPARSFGAEDLGVLGNLVLPWGRPSIDVRLVDGVGELDAAALLEVYGYSQAARATAVSAAGTVTSRHGLTLRTTLSAGRPALVAGEARSRAGRGGFDAAFEQLSRDTSGTTLRSVAKMLEYPLDRVGPPAPSVAAQWRTPLLLAAVAGLALGAGSLPYLLGRRRPSRKRGSGRRRPATASAAVRPGRSPVVR
jgi:putative intracellular protease/amidase